MEIHLIILILTQFVGASQPINALAFIFDGLHYGVSDFKYAACSMVSGTMLVIVVQCQQVMMQIAFLINVV